MIKLLLKLLMKILFIPLILLSAGCAMPGKTFVALVWIDSDKPDLFFLNNTSVIPQNINLVQKGAYYEVPPGTLNLKYAYSTGQSYDFYYNIIADTPIMGKEYAYYDIMLFKSEQPRVFKFPTDHWK